MNTDLNRDAHRQIQFGMLEGPAPRYKGLTTQSVYVTMRDGVKLAVEVILPKNLPSDARIPALLQQTRYWRTMELRAPFKWFLKPEDLNPATRGFKSFFTGRGYALVLVDVRGSGASFGTSPYPWPRDSIADAGEIVDWIVAQPWSNGRVGGMGVSCVGTTAELLAVTNHPAVKAVIPRFNQPDAYRDIACPGGMFNARFIREWSRFDCTLDQNRVPRDFGLLGRLIVKGVKPVRGDEDCRLLQEAIRAHAANGEVYELARAAAYCDERCADVDVCFEDLAVHNYAAEIECSDVAIYGWGSWMDAGTADAVIRRFLTFENAGRAVIGAWDHGGQYHASPYMPPDASVNPGLPAQWLEMIRFFDCYLKDIDNGVRSERALFYYTMGEEKWKRTAVWPPAGTQTQRWYLGENRTLLPYVPTGESGADTYAVDFEASTGEHNRWWEIGPVLKKTIIYADRAAATRHMLTYTSPPLAEDVEIAGYPIVNLYVTCTETDAAFYVYLEDVDESGRVTYVTEGQLRAIHRKVSDAIGPYQLQVPYHSFKQEDALPLVPGEVAQITFGLLPTSVLIRRGHCLRIAIAGHDAGTFVRIPAQGTPVISIARNQLYASYVDLPVVQRR